LRTLTDAATVTATMTSLIGLRKAQTLGHLGLLPFFALALLSWSPADAAFGSVPLARLAQLLLVAYSAVILSFLGAVHWGFALLTPALERSAIGHALTWGVLPSLLGWLALLMIFVGIKAWLVLVFLIGDLLLSRLMDGTLLRLYPAAPDWYLGLRTRLTFGAVLALVLAVPASS
jgi:hypothetical protein